jgi:hypothetical protein
MLCDICSEITIELSISPKFSTVSEAKEFRICSCKVEMVLVLTLKITRPRSTF